MASRRMFNIGILEGDTFLDMDSSSQMLYIHLSMNADDEGFISSVKKVMRYCQASQNDLDEIIKNGYLIKFDTGVAVIRDWNLHNKIQADRKKGTLYLGEKALIELGKDGIYYMKTDCIHNVSNMDTDCIHNVSRLISQDSIGKESIVKDSTGELSTGKGTGENQNCQLTDEKQILGCINQVFGTEYTDIPSDCKMEFAMCRMARYSYDEFTKYVEYLKKNDLEKYKDDYRRIVNHDLMKEVLGR